MPNPDSIPEMICYRVVLISKDTEQIFLLSDKTLPQISILTRTRPAWALQHAIQAQWKQSAIVLDFLHNSSGAPVCVAELFSDSPPMGLISIALDQILELTETERAVVSVLCHGDTGTRGPFSRVGWMDEAIAWVEEASRCKISSACEIEQYNACGAFALMRFPLACGRVVWLKATGEPNRHELSITAALAAISPESLPPLLAVRSDWNAWLMEGTGEPLDTYVEEATLEHAVTSIAALQKRTIPHGEVLFAAGAMNHRTQILCSNIGELIAYLEEAMEQQTSTKVPRIKAPRLREIGAILDDACGAIEELGIPDTILHNDINPGNLLFSEDRCVFTDWCEASIGNPFITLEHLLLLLPRDEKQAEAARSRLKQAYRECWRDWFWDRQIDRGMTLATLLAAFSSLYGRGDWLRSARRYDSAMQSYARSLARQMDRAALAMEVVCR